MKKTYLLVILVSILFYACKEDVVNINDNMETDEAFSTKVDIGSSYDIGSVSEKFIFRISTFDTTQSILDGKQIRWDFNSDKDFDTEWSSGVNIEHVFESTGIKTVTAQVKVSDNSIAECSKKVYIEELTDLMQGDTTYFVQEMCYSFDESEIYFVWENYPHKIYKMNNDGSNIVGVTLNLPSEQCRHYPVASNDGQYLAYTYNNGVNVLNLNTNEEKRILEQMYLYGFFTNDSKSFVTSNGSEIHLVNVETGHDSLLITGLDGAYISSVPNENKIGIMDLNTKGLVIYNLDEKREEAVYQDVPVIGQFKIVEGIKAIYSIEEHSLYSLTTNKKYSVHINGVMSGWPSDISKDGSNVLLATYKGLKKLTLPSDLF